MTPVPVPEPEAAPSLATATGPATRTRKAKTTQLKLGVGRPAVAGGVGARAVTKSDSLPKVKRGKPSRVGRPTEEPIAEGKSYSCCVVHILDPIQSNHKISKQVCYHSSMHP